MIFFRKFLLWGAFHAFLLVAYMLLYRFSDFSEGFLHPRTFHLLLFFALQSLVLLFWHTDGPRFFTLVWIAWLFRMLTSLAFLILMLWIGVQKPVSFTLHFASLYLLYLFFELFFSLRILHDNEKSSSTVK